MAARLNAVGVYSASVIVPLTREAVLEESAKEAGFIGSFPDAAIEFCGISDLGSARIDLIATYARI